MLPCDGQPGLRRGRAGPRRYHHKTAVEQAHNLALRLGRARCIVWCEGNPGLQPKESIRRAIHRTANVLLLLTAGNVARPPVRVCAAHWGAPWDPTGGRA